MEPYTSHLDFLGKGHHMPSPSSPRFQWAFKDALDRAALGLPPGFRKVFWQFDEDGTQWAVIGSPEGAFSLSVDNKKVSLWNPHCSSSAGTWPIEPATALLVAQAVLDGLTAIANELDLPPCLLGSWDHGSGRRVA
jgi:hypothetical protein